MENSTQFDIGQVRDTALQVLTEPVEFYRTMPKTGGFTNPIIFLVVMALVTGAMFTFVSFLGVRSAGAIAISAAAIIFFPIMALIASFVSAAIVFIIWKLMGSQESFETAYRCLAFASAIYPVMAVLSLIPYLGSLITVVWGVYLLIVAGIEVHRLNPQRVYLVFGVLGVLLLISNLSSEIASRRLASSVDKIQSHVSELEKMSPKDAGKAVGEFLKGLEESTKDD